MDCIGLRQVNQLEGQTYSRPVRELRPRQTGCCRACRHLTQRTLIRYGPGLNPETELRAKANFSGAHVERAERIRLRTELWKGIHEMLTPEQKEKYDAFKFYRTALGRFGRAKLTAEQKATVKTLCAEPGKAYAAEKDRKAKRKILGDLQKKIHDEVLTDQQREALKKPREKKPAPDKTEPVVKD